MFSAFLLRNHDGGRVRIASYYLRHHWKKLSLDLARQSSYFKVMDEKRQRNVSFSLIYSYCAIHVVHSQNVSFQNVRFQNVWFQKVRSQNIRFTKRQVY